MNKWDERFMSLAETVAEWSSCYQQNRHVGAVAVKDKRVLTTGYNGAPAGIESCSERGECLRRVKNIPSGTMQEVCYAVHAEQNAIIHASREAMLGATMYMTGIEVDSGDYVKNANSCSLCKRMIINAGIETVVVRDTENEYRVINVQEWIDNDESLFGRDSY